MMGNHYVPQRYLRNFEVPEKRGFVRMFDKKGTLPRAVPIVKTAQKSGFYDPVFENQLNLQVEIPGNAATEKLCRELTISESERFDLSRYIGTMMMRVPDRREKTKALMPRVFSKTRERVHEQIIDIGRQSGVDPATIESRLAETDHIIDRFATEPPPEAVARVRAPWPTKRVLAAIYRMTWRVLFAKGPSFFVTTDNPVFFFPTCGLGRPSSELTFPLSTKCGLHGCYQSGRSTLLFLHAEEPLVREVNRRMVHAATRLVYYHQPAQWLERLTGKTDIRLQRLVW